MIFFLGSTTYDNTLLDSLDYNQHTIDIAISSIWSRMICTTTIVCVQSQYEREKYLILDLKNADKPLNKYVYFYFYAFV